MADNNLEELKLDLVSEIQQRVTDKILEQSNADLLIKLINRAETETEAMNIAALGTTYKRTGFHFDKRLEKISNNIKYKAKNDRLSFVNDENRPTHELIIGDNYDALQNLLITHKGKIDVIYIDPPYGKDNMGDFAKTNYNNSITRDNLLSMLYPRLLMAKRLLTPEGVIFCSIDDKNQAYVKCLFDEVFGEENFVSQYFWKRTSTPPALSKKVRKKLETVLCYENNKNTGRSYAQGLIDGDDAPLLNNGNPIGRLTFPIGSVHFSINDGLYSGNRTIILENEVEVRDGVNVNEMIASGHFKWGQENLDSEIAKGTYFLVKSNAFSIRYQKEDISTKVPSNIIDSEVNVGTNEDANAELERLGITDFDYPKPTSLISFLVRMPFWEKSDITILDFFAGSGTTGQAVMELNKEDGGNRTFILCTNNEITDKTPNGIAYDVTAKRLKRVMSGECYDGTNNFPWLEDHEPYRDNLNVYEIETVSKTEYKAGETAFDKIDETCYGLPKFEKLTDKIEWVCKNFENATKMEGVKSC